MTRFVLLSFVLVLTIPAFAKSHNPKQPVACTDLWPAVTATLANEKNYKVVAMDSDEMKADFIVTGSLYPAMNLVQLKEKKRGCDLELRVGFTGADDEAAFRTRVSRAFKVLTAAKASAAQTNSGAAQ
jgi:hypothetical protein